MKNVWYFLQGLAVLLVIGAPLLGYALGQPLVGWLVFAGLIGLHLYELTITIPLARKKSIPTGEAITKTMLFGFTWWVPVKRGIFVK